MYISRKFLFTVVVLIIIIGAWFFLKNTGNSTILYGPQTIAGKDLDSAIARGIDFLVEQQRFDGGFDIQLCDTTEPERCDPIRSAVNTAGVIAHLDAFDDDPRISLIIKRAIAFIKADMQLSPDGKHGVWNLFAQKDIKYGRIPADIDGIALVSFVLGKYGEGFPGDVTAFDIYRNPSGLYLNWISEEWNQTEQDRHAFAGGSVQQFPNPDYFGVDCVVNTDVLSYFSSVQEETEPLCTYINEVIEKRLYPECSFYYRNPYLLFSVVTNAATNRGAACLEQSVDPIVQEIISTVRSDGTWSENFLSNIFAVSALLQAGYTGTEVDRAVEYILSEQQEDGGWKNATIFPDLYNPVFYGSPEITTTGAMYVLDLYRNAKDN